MELVFMFVLCGALIIFTLISIAGSINVSRELDVLKTQLVFKHQQTDQDIIKLKSLNNCQDEINKVTTEIERSLEEKIKTICNYLQLDLIKKIGGKDYMFRHNGPSPISESRFLAEANQIRSAVDKLRKDLEGTREVLSRTALQNKEYSEDTVDVIGELMDFLGLQMIYEEATEEEWKIVKKKQPKKTARRRRY